MGDPSNTAAAAAEGRQVSQAEADDFACSVLPTIMSLQRSGATSLRGIASARNARGIRTARCGTWQVSNVSNVLRRANGAAKAQGGRERPPMASASAGGGEGAHRFMWAHPSYRPAADLCRLPPK